MIAAAFLVLCYSPRSVRSGIAQLMTQLNGVNLPGLFGIANLFVRAIGSALIAAAGLSGVAEMMASIGASVAV